MEGGISPFRSKFVCRLIIFKVFGHFTVLRHLRLYIAQVFVWKRTFLRKGSYYNIKDYCFSREVFSESHLPKNKVCCDSQNVMKASTCRFKFIQTISQSSVGIHKYKDTSGTT